MLQIGAGTGLLFILRWFRWRINAVSEIVAMVVSFAVTLKLNDFGLASWQELLLGVGITTACWMTAALLSPPADSKTLKSFCRHINPGGPGWRGIYRRLAADGVSPQGSSVNIPRGILCMLLGCAAVYGVLFGTGFFLYGELVNAVIPSVLALCASAGIGALRFND